MLSSFYFCFIFLASIYPAIAVIPNYIPAIETHGLSRDDIVEKYFTLGFSNAEILGFIVNVHGIRLSLRQLKRILQKRNCKRRNDQDDLEDVVRAIENELNGSGSIIGYRSMHQRLTNEYGLVVTRNTVRLILKILDPDGVESRSRHRLRRRLYSVKGPNYIWHIDGYDKLKPFGFCIHGGIDGYSRRILWLEVSSSNNDPEIVGKYYADYVDVIKGTARIIRADRGTENVNVEVMQRFFRRATNDDFAQDKSFMYGRSTSNQRIESWWGLLRKVCTDWWIRFFKDLRDVGLFDDDDVIERECIKFCFMDIIQAELHRVARNWNTHRIRPSNNAESPPGRPDILYFNPEALGTRDYLTPVDADEREIAQEMCCTPTLLRGCSEEFNSLAEMILEDEGLEMPTNAEDAKNLYIALLAFIREIEDINLM